jgi:hypothetical protein
VDADSRIRVIEHAILKALPDGWQLSRQSMWWTKVSDYPGFQWIVSSGRVDLGFFQLRLIDDLETLVFVHSTDIHNFPPNIEEAVLIRVDAQSSNGLSDLLGELMRTRRPNVAHPT